MSLDAMPNPPPIKSPTKMYMNTSSFVFVSMPIVLDFNHEEESVCQRLKCWK